MLLRPFHRLPVAASPPSFLQISAEHPPSSSPFEANTQLKHLVKAGRLVDARQLFDQMRQRDEISWTTVISGYISSYNPKEALSLFRSLLSDPSLSPDSFILSLALKACSRSPFLHSQGHTVHAYALKSGAIGSVFVGSSLLDFHSRAAPADPSAALKVFDEMPHRNVVTWTSAIAALVRAGNCCAALRLFSNMLAPYDSHTFAIALKACTDAGLLLAGREIHAVTLKDGQSGIPFVANALITHYSKSCCLPHAIAIFESMRAPDVASWTTLISTYSQAGHPYDAITAFLHLLARPMDGSPNDYTYAAAISACSMLADSGLGIQIHARSMRRGFSSAPSVSNALVTMYARAGLLPAATVVFREVATKDVVSWSAVIAAHAQEGCAAESFSLYNEMQLNSGLSLIETTLASLLSACAFAAVLDGGRQVHARAFIAGLESNPMVTSALIAMYAKCGGIEEARNVFVSVRPTDTISWTAMITGYAEHGRSVEAIRLFEEMHEKEIKRDRVAYLGVLSACSHGGMVEDGLRYLDEMRREGMEAEKEHYGCLVDMMGRAGRLEAAEGIVEGMASEGMADEVAWTALLRASESRGEDAMGRRAAERAMEMNPRGNAGVKVVMANMYAKGRSWREAAQVRKEMREKGVKKEVGWSWVAGGGGEVEVFVSAGRENSRVEEVYDMIGLVDFGARMVGRETDLEGEWE